MRAPIEYQNVAIQNYRNENGQGSAEINSEFAGPNGTARVSGKMNLNSGTWSVDRLEVTFEDGTQLVIPPGAWGSKNPPMHAIDVQRSTCVIATNSWGC